MGSYIVVFEWPAATRISAQTAELDVTDIEDAKLQAALMYGSEPFSQGLPIRYRIFDRRGAQVFCYPQDA